MRLWLVSRSWSAPSDAVIGCPVSPRGDLKTCMLGEIVGVANSFVTDIASCYAWDKRPRRGAGKLGIVDDCGSARGPGAISAPALCRSSAGTGRGRDPRRAGRPG